MSKTKGLNENYEYIVIGTGPGGGTVARELALGGKKVLIIEAGAWHKHGLGSLLGIRILKGYLLFSRSREGVIVARGMTVGGSSMVYNGNVFDPPDFLYEEMGLDFRIEVDELKKEIGVRTLPEKFFMNAQGGVKVREAAAKMGITFRAQEKFIDPERCSVGCDWCMMGCPRNAKWTTRNYVEDALSHGADLLLSSAVDRILFDKKGRAIGVKLGNGASLYADKIVLSAGGIGTPQILLRSGMKNVGRSFFMDPMNVVTGYADNESGGAWKEMTFTHATDDFEHSDGFLIGNVGGSYALLSNFSRIKTMRKNALKMLPLMKRGIGLFVKLGDNPNGNVFKNGRFTKPMDDDDRKRMKKGTDICREILVRAGIKKSSLAVAEMIGGHPGGTAAMGLIVDRNFMTEHDNLFVCDGSVLPVSPGAPPSLAILAYSKLCGKMLVGKVRPEDRMVKNLGRHAGA
ncbi:MAG TPA: GMC family oxidoreductase [Spirochaetota bacterium]|nr:GMC family oxidoreductase [Spirochaetota bacterium]HPI88495.1 GMC family oxidoreductase [Spirochaetota bacterium]HPR47975.1 GMC family oxidoreductase [Spirochaetota bacterium]